MEDIKDIEQYLQFVGRFRGSEFGRQFRNQFRDIRGTAELAMLASPSDEEFDDFRRTVAAMTDEEKARPDSLSDDQIKNIARRAEADIGNVGIFINGYVLARRKAEAGLEQEKSD